MHNQAIKRRSLIEHPRPWRLDVQRDVETQHHIKDKDGDTGRRYWKCGICATYL